MATLDDLFTERNQLLFNILFRHQAYLDGYRTGLVSDFKQRLTTLYGEFARYLAHNHYQQLDALTRAELSQFILLFTRSIDAFYSAYTAQLIAALQRFLAADVSVQRAMMQHATGKTTDAAYLAQPQKLSRSQFEALPSQQRIEYTRVADHYELSQAYHDNADASGIYGPAAADGSKEGNARLWAFVQSAPIPANGLTIAQSLNNAWQFARNTAVALVTKGYANSATNDQLRAALIGGSGVPGLLQTLERNQIAVLTAVVQHVTNEVGATVASLYYERYQWVSILDSRTTVICWNRNGTIYVYGKGPLAPAHYGCRSRCVPVQNGTKVHAIPGTYVDWLLSQPEAFVRDAYGAGVAGLLGDPATLRARFALISSIKPLTLTEFRGKVKYILGD